MKELFWAVLSVALMSTVAYAQEEVTSLLVPANAWLVGPTTLEDGSAAEGGMPCVMVNKFSNDVEMRISGGAEEILAMALTVNEKAFEKDQSYLVTIGFDANDGIQIPAQAFNENTLVVGLEEGKNFYKSLKESDAMVIKLGSASLEFSLLGVPQGLKRLENCFQPVARITAMPETASAPSVIPEQEAAGLRTLYAAESKKINEMIDMATGDALPSVPAEEPMSAPEAEVSKAEPEPKEEPVKEPEVVPVPVRDVKPRDILSSGAHVMASEGQQMRWRVMKGGGLQGVLGVWAQSANARLVWKSDQSFSVPESLALQGTFEAAVETVLAQFPAGQTRPVGKIYFDPAAQQKVLVIEVDKPVSRDVEEGNYAPIVAP